MQRDSKHETRWTKTGSFTTASLFHARGRATPQSHVAVTMPSHPQADPPARPREGAVMAMRQSASGGEHPRPSRPTRASHYAPPLQTRSGPGRVPMRAREEGRTPPALGEERGRPKQLRGGATPRPGPAHPRAPRRRARTIFLPRSIPARDARAPPARWTERAGPAPCPQKQLAAWRSRPAHPAHVGQNTGRSASVGLPDSANRQPQRVTHCEAGLWRMAVLTTCVWRARTLSPAHHERVAELNGRLCPASSHAEQQPLRRHFK